MDERNGSERSGNGRGAMPWEQVGAAAARDPSRGRSPDPPRRDGHSHALQEIKGRVHRRLLERLNLSNIDGLEREVVLGEVRRVLHELLAGEQVPLNND
ncbi:MAG TPA: hypothetical protein VMN39_04070, partial [Longimicrobiaceae bacterium]|nr:hypothetical protein [Longimicrobiaceae bacterium]